MARTLYNHSRRVIGSQPGMLKAVYSGMIVKFNYASKKVSDKSPVVLILHNDYYTDMIHGINLNYLTETQIKTIISPMTEGLTKSNKDDISIDTIDQNKSDYDDKLPNRNLLPEKFTRIDLPYFKGMKNGNTISKLEAYKQMDRLYEKHIKKFVKKYDMYRTYSYKKIKKVKVLKYDIRGLLK